MSDIQHAYPLILNKVASPHYVTPLLRRARLIDWLNDAANCRAVVLAADAGYGKTTLLWQWEREVPFPCYWYKLDRNDRDWTFHISYLIESIAKRHEGFGRRAHSMLQQMGGPGSSRPGVAAYLLAEMHQRLTEPCTFIIDDWQYVNAVTEVRGLWNQILRDAPPTCRFVFASRVKPRLQFARFKTHGGYSELRTDALRFTEPEIAELFRDVYNDPLDPSELAELERRTEGWAASLQLVEVSLRERSSPDERREFIRSITATTDSALFEFLAEEVLDQQPEETRNFLLTTSILQQMTPEVAERLAGVHDGRRELTDLEQRGLFTNRLDEERYRYHNLFREFLERRLTTERSESEVVGLHIHAASYFETTEQWPEAIHHYLRAGLQRQAARLIAKYGEEVVASGGLGLVDEWLRQLPGEAIKQNARLSLLYGEASGIRGDWDVAVEALERARAYFARKGDKRLEALACLKLSTVYTHRGDPDSAEAAADAGIALAPPDAIATRLRLEGNLAVTRTWLAESLEAATQACQRIAIEALSRGLDHYAAIAYHNAGELLHRMGRVTDAITSLERAAAIWHGPPTSPFADNSQLVTALVAKGNMGRARMVATEATRRTRPWPRPYADACNGLATVLMAEGQFGQAVTVLDDGKRHPAALGALHGLLTAHQVDALYLANASRDLMQAAYADLTVWENDRRYSAETEVARALAAHYQSACAGECTAAAVELDGAGAAGAVMVQVTGGVKIGLLAFDHRRKHDVSRAWARVADAVDSGFAPSLRWWLRRYEPFAESCLKSEGAALLCKLADLDPEGWRSALTRVLPKTAGADRERTLASLARHANRETVEALREVPGPDVQEVRRQLQFAQASRLYLRTLGGISLHRGDWNGPMVAVEKKRVRLLLALLAARAHTTLSRDACVELLWPNADADAAINSLNQTVFQLRRYIDPYYRGGASPDYIISTAEQVALNPELVHTDLFELRRLPARIAGANWNERQTAARKAISLVRGEFLADLPYEDWSAAQQIAAHAEIRQLLMPIALGDGRHYAEDVSLQAAAALMTIDPWDEGAVLAMVSGLARSGRRVAARKLIVSYAARLDSELDERPSREVLAAAAEVGALSGQQSVDYSADSSDRGLTSPLDAAKVPVRR